MKAAMKFFLAAVVLSLVPAGAAPALVDDEVYVFHQWPVDDAGDQTRH